MCQISQQWTLSRVSFQLLVSYAIPFVKLNTQTIYNKTRSPHKNRKEYVGTFFIQIFLRLLYQSSRIKFEYINFFLYLFCVEVKWSEKGKKKV